MHLATTLAIHCNFPAGALQSVYLCVVYCKTMSRYSYFIRLLLYGMSIALSTDDQLVSATMSFQCLSVLIRSVISNRFMNRIIHGQIRP